jgi:hypothetical protein
MYGERVKTESIHYAKQSYKVVKGLLVRFVELL